MKTKKKTKLGQGLIQALKELVKKEKKELKKHDVPKSKKTNKARFKVNLNLENKSLK